jgi:hypothetical protein
MSDHTFGILDLMLGFGVPLAWGIWELVKLRRDKRRRPPSED